MKDDYGSILKPFTVYRQEYFDMLPKECGADEVQLEINLEWLAKRGNQK